MPPTGKKYLIAVLGPTASGKTSMAIQLAQHYNTEIISADSRQLYKEITIGTAKPTFEERAAAVHHFVDHVSITDEHSAGRFEQEALELLEELYNKHDVVIMAGGSGLYIQAVLEGFDELPKIDPSIREQLNNTLKTQGVEALQEMLHDLDPDYYNEVDLNNPQRIVRALEVCIGSGKPFSSFRQGNKQRRNFTPIKIGIAMDRELLYERINKRVDLMMDAGLLEEARALHHLRGLNALETVGYTELFDYFEDKHDLEEAVELIKRNSRRYAKRQMTWTRKDPDIVWFGPNDIRKVIDHIEA